VSDIQDETLSDDVGSPNADWESVRVQFDLARFEVVADRVATYLRVASPEAPHRINVLDIGSSNANSAVAWALLYSHYGFDVHVDVCDVGQSDATDAEAIDRSLGAFGLSGRVALHSTHCGEGVTLKFAGRRFDFIYVGGSHEYAPTLANCAIAAKLAGDTAVIAGDGYDYINARDRVEAVSHVFERLTVDQEKWFVYLSDGRSIRATEHGATIRTIERELTIDPQSPWASLPGGADRNVLIGLSDFVSSHYRALNRRHLDVLDFGTSFGRNASAWATLFDEQGFLVHVDTLEDSDADVAEEVVRQIVIDSGLESHIRMYRVGKNESLVQLLAGQPYDFVFVDGRFAYNSVAAAIVVSLKLVSEAGIIAGTGFDEDNPGVIEAVTDLFGAGSITVLFDNVWVIDMANRQPRNDEDGLGAFIRAEEEYAAKHAADVS
jgi:hypothetical protein